MISDPAVWFTVSPAVEPQVKSVRLVQFMIQIVELLPFLCSYLRRCLIGYWVSNSVVRPENHCTCGNVWWYDNNGDDNDNDNNDNNDDNGGVGGDGDDDDDDDDDINNVSFL